MDLLKELRLVELANDYWIAKLNNDPIALKKAEEIFNKEYNQSETK